MSSAGRLATAAEAKALYRKILKHVKKMENPAQQNYYYSYARDNFIQHMDEDDPKRIRQIINAGKQHTKWVLAKYAIEDEQPDL